MNSLSNIISKTEDTSSSDYQYICMYDYDLKVIDYCANYAALNGIKGSVLIGKPIAEVYTDLPSRRAQFEKILSSGTPGSNTVQFTSITNEVVYAEEQICRLNKGLVVIGKDITKSKKEREAKEEHEYALSLIAKHSSQYFLLVDLEGKILFINKTDQGLTMEEVIGSYVYDYQDEKNKRIIQESIATVLRTKEANRYEVSAKVGNGKDMTFEGVISPIIEDGIVVKFGITTDGITERKKVVNELKAIKKQYVNLLKLTNSITFTQDKSLRYTSVLNPNTSVLNPNEDFDEQSVIGKTDRELFTPFHEDAQKSEHDKLEVLRTGKNIRRDSKLIVNGEIFHYDLLIQPLVNEEQETIGITCTSIDITERIRRKEALEKSERRLKEAEEIAQLGYYDIDVVSGNINWSDETYRIVGVDPNEYSPHIDSLLDIVHEEDQGKLRKELAEIAKTSEGSKLTYRFKEKDNKIQHIRNSSKVSCNKEGEIVRIFGTIQDITQQVKLRVKLNDQKVFIQKIVDSSPSLIFILDLEKKENIFINNASQQLLGYSKEEVQRNHNLFLKQLSNITLADVENNVLNKEAATFLSFIHPAERELFIEFIHVFVKDKSDRIFDLNFRHQYKEGKWMWLHHRLIAFNRNEEGKVTQLLGIVSDISSLKEAEKKSKMAMIDGQEKERRRIAKDLHDAINPLLSAAKLNVESLQIVDGCKDQQTNLANIVSLLSRSMEEIKDISFDLMPAILKDFGLVFTLQDYCKKITAGGVLKVNLDIHGIETRLGEVLEIMLFRIAQELINNVIKHANASLVEVQLVAHRKTFILMVEDNGKGIDNTTNIVSSKSYGLKNVESRAKALNGTIAIDSIKNRGTIITIEIPRKG